MRCRYITPLTKLRHRHVSSVRSYSYTTFLYTMYWMITCSTYDNEIVNSTRLSCEIYYTLYLDRISSSPSMTKSSRPEDRSRRLDTKGSSASCLFSLNLPRDTLSASRYRYFTWNIIEKSVPIQPILLTVWYRNYLVAVAAKTSSWFWRILGNLFCLLISWFFFFFSCDDFFVVEIIQILSPQTFYKQWD